MFRLKKRTDCKWINLFEVFYKHKTTHERSWTMCSRKDYPITDAAKAWGIFYHYAQTGSIQFTTS
ncbi:MAG: hypothetical protein Q7T18_02000 [Sedimentisphaerales bacterium]|nr:hypothetical protein [Sedimentisphaerales bacterium]